MLSAQRTYRHVKSRNVGGEPFSSTYWPLWYPSRALTNLQTGTLRCHQQWTGCIKLHSLYASLSSWPGVGSDSPRGCIGGPWQPHLSARWSVLCRCCFFPSAKSAVFVMAEIAPIRVFCPFCDLTSWVFMEVESWLQIEGFTFGVRKPLTFSPVWPGGGRPLGEGVNKSMGAN